MDRNNKSEQQNKTNNKYELQTRFFNSKLDKEDPLEASKEENKIVQNPPKVIETGQKRICEFKKSPLETGWNNRYNRGGHIKSSIVEEDEELFKEHLEALKRKEQFDFNKLEKEELIHIYLNDKEITEENFSKSISETGLNQKVKNNLKKMSYDLLTPIQRCILPYALKRKDCLGCAQTGSGKTIAFLAPIVSLMLEEGCPKNEMSNSYCSYPICLILVPTRELAEQIYKEVRKVIHQTGIVAAKLYGGVPNDSQIRELKQGIDIVIGTPGRIIEHIERKFMHLNLIKYLVIDESDRMLDMGFEDQMKAIVFNSQMPDKTKRSNLMFSATIPHGVLSISQKFMNETYLISSSSQNETGNANSNVEQIIHYVEDDDKIGKLHEVFQQIKGNAIIFLETKKSVDKLENFLERRNYSVCAIHGDKPQAQRQEVIQLFSSGEIPILIATDVVSRGLDFPNVAYVFNFDMPKNIEDYIHRIGRTGRVGNKGTAISFFNERNGSIAKDLYNVLSKMNQQIPNWLYDYCDQSNCYYREKKNYGNKGSQRNNSKQYYGNSYSNKGGYTDSQRPKDYDNDNDNDRGGGSRKFSNKEFGNKSQNNIYDNNQSNHSRYNNSESNIFSNQKETSNLMFFNSKNNSNAPIFKDLSEKNNFKREDHK